MYGAYSYIYHKNQPNCRQIYQSHGSYGLWRIYFMVMVFSCHFYTTLLPQFVSLVFTERQPSSVVPCLSIRHQLGDPRNQPHSGGYYVVISSYYQYLQVIWAQPGPTAENLLGWSRSSCVKWPFLNLVYMCIKPIYSNKDSISKWSW